MLESFIKQTALRTAEEVGFGYVLVLDAPDPHAALLEAYLHSRAKGKPPPIWSANSDDSIYPSPTINKALCFWHDVNHVRRRLDFCLVDEAEFSLWHLSELEKAGHARGSLVWRRLHADLTGQAYVQALARRFPFDQRRVATGCLTAGFDHGLLAYLRSGGES